MPTYCRHCAAELPRDARFCPACATETTGVETLGGYQEPHEQPVDGPSDDDFGKLIENITSGRFVDNLFSFRRAGLGLLVYLFTGAILGWSVTLALIAGGAAWIIMSVSNTSPLSCPHCGKAVKHSARTCHHCGRDVV